MEQQSLLSEVEFNPVFATVGQRFVNYLIDLVMFVIFWYLLIIIFLMAGGTIHSYRPYSGPDLLFRLFVLFIYACFMFLQEMLFNGRTVGKFITGTKALNEDGTEMEPKTIFLRSLYRAVPFEPFSAFGGHPWHDKWTRTFVIDVRKTNSNNFSADVA